LLPENAKNLRRSNLDMPPTLPPILLIEKDDITLEIYQRELCQSFTVFPFNDLSGILETLTQVDIQAIVIEPEICAGQGWEWIEAVYTILSGRNVPIIICTTRDAPGKSSGAGIARYLTKPVLPKTLRQNLLEVLASRHNPGRAR
jgi:DNA-binding response OmpR family regulator